jgi:hypothetical protein
MLFMWDRLALVDAADIGGRPPCLEEDWFVEDAVGHGSPFVWRGLGAEESHRLLYRYARKAAHERWQFGGQPHLLLLHQMTTLLPAIATEAVSPKIDSPTASQSVSSPTPGDSEG